MYLLGAAILIGIVVLALRKKGGTASGGDVSPLDKFLIDVNTPGTPVYQAFDSYNKSAQPGLTYEQALPGHIDYHTSMADGWYNNVYLRKDRYTPNEVVAA